MELARSEKIQAAAEWSRGSRPRNLTEVRAFAVLASYSTIQLLAAHLLRSPNLNLHEVKKKNTRFVWGPQQDSAFQTFKECLINAPVLVIPTEGGGFVVVKAFESTWPQWQNVGLSVDLVTMASTLT